MKKIQSLLFITLLISCISCNKSLKDSKYHNYNVKTTGVEDWLDSWNGVFYAESEYVQVGFIDDYHVFLTIYSRETGEVSNSYNFTYTYDQKNKNGRIFVSPSSTLSFWIYNDKPKRILISVDKTNEKFFLYDS